MALTFERRKTSKDRLQIRWDYPASMEVEQDAGTGRTRSVARMYALERDAALAKLRGDDPRPLLVVRECGRCKGTNDALLSRTLDNERTLLLSRWFHCVKLKHHVVKDDHTFSALFAGQQPPHLFLASADGEAIVPLPGDQSQSDLWAAMHDMLDAAYERDARQALKELNKLLARFDDLDSQEDQLLEQIDREVERRGPKSAKMRRLQAKLRAVQDKKAKAREREDEVVDLGLKPAE
ncbi:MAG: hypothetical protein AAF628_10660 [Planctomycetota bacterium]